jgi:hypothetical protein
MIGMANKPATLFTSGTHEWAKLAPLMCLFTIVEVVAYGAYTGLRSLFVKH